MSDDETSLWSWAAWPLRPNATSSLPDPITPDIKITIEETKSDDLEELETLSPNSDEQEQEHVENVDKKGVGGVDPIYEQVFIHNPCYCECALSANVDWIAAFELFWGLANTLVCIVTVAVTSSRQSLPGILQQFANAGKKLTPQEAAIIKVAMSLHIFECLLAWLLMVAASRRIRLLCLLWILSTLITMTCQIVLVSMAQIVATYMGVGTHPLNIYFIYVVWALRKEIRAFRGGHPIPIVRQIAGGPVQITIDLEKGQGKGPRAGKNKKKTKKKKPTFISAPIPILIPTCGWGYYPDYYGALDHGFYSYRHPYCLHDKTGGAGDGVDPVLEENPPKTREVRTEFKDFKDE